MRTVKREGGRIDPNVQDQVVASLSVITAMKKVI